MSSGILVAHLATTSAYAGFQWCVQGVVYPQFDRVPPADFPAYERRHQQRISRVVGPLFAGLVVTTAAVALARPGGTSVLAASAAAVLLAVVLGVTALLAVPLHRRLDERWDPIAHRRLLRVDLVRTLAATADAALAVVLLT